MKSIGLGILSAITASICCIGPLILIALGFGSLGLNTIIGKYHGVFLLVGILLLLFSWGRYFRRKKRCEIKKCQEKNSRLTLITLAITTIIVLFFAGLNFYTYARTSDNVNKIVSTAGLKTVIIPVEGMTCFICEFSVSKALKKIDGVVNVEASAKEGIAKIAYDAEKTNIDQLITTINQAGYRAKPPRSQ